MISAALNAIGNAYLVASQLTRHLYTKQIRNMNSYCSILDHLVLQLIAAFKNIRPAMCRKKTKLHLLMHAASQVQEFGPLRLYMTEAQERQNASIWQRIARTTRLDASKDVMIRYQLEGAVLAVRGGLTLMAHGEPHVLGGLPALPRAAAT